MASITGCAISVDDVREYETSRRNPVMTDTETDTRMPDERRVLTFAELQELIETGRVDQIPNNKAIPDALNVSLQVFFFSHREHNACCRTFPPASLLRQCERNLGSRGGKIGVPKQSD